MIEHASVSDSYGRILPQGIGGHIRDSSTAGLGQGNLIQLFDRLRERLIRRQREE